ncbi:MAG: hypothetical protein KC613_26345, partial [Myxococcales bacterium]|nr:hypothetical protein [Myxococcales bacterium]
TTLTVGGDISHVRPEHMVVEAGGCGEEDTLLRRQTHHQTGAAVHARLEHRTGAVFAAQLRTVRGELVDDAGLEATDEALRRSAYWMVGGGLATGYHRRNVGLEVGGGWLTEGRQTIGRPYGQLRLGSLDFMWFEMTVGSLDPAFYLRNVAMGVAGRGRRLRARFALSSVRHALQIDPDGHLQLAENVDLLGPELFGAEVELQLQPGQTLPLSVVVGALLADKPAGRLGLSYRF